MPAPYAIPHGSQISREEETTLPPPSFFCFMMAEFYSCCVGTLCASLAEQRCICAFKGNVSLPHCCLKMQRGISAPNGLRLKIKIGEVRSSTSVDCLGFSGVSARTLLLPFP